MLRLVAILGLLLGAAPAAAYRPFDGTDADVAELGEFELELGPAQYLYAGPGPAGAGYSPRHSLIAPAIILNLGVLHRVELVLEGKNFVDLAASPQGPRLRLEDTGFYVKVVLREGCLQHGRGPSVATEIGPLLPATGAARVGASGAVIISQRAGFGTAHLNLAALFTREETADLFAGLILEGPAGWRVRPVGEAWYQRELGDRVGEPAGALAQRTSVSGLLGLIWKARDGLAIDAAVRVADEEGVRVYEVRVGLTLTLEVWHPR